MVHILFVGGTSLIVDWLIRSSVEQLESWATCTNTLWRQYKWHCIKIHVDANVDCIFVATNWKCKRTDHVPSSGAGFPLSASNEQVSLLQIPNGEKRILMQSTWRVHFYTQDILWMTFLPSWRALLFGSKAKDQMPVWSKHVSLKFSRCPPTTAQCVWLRLTSASTR